MAKHMDDNKEMEEKMRVKINENYHLAGLTGANYTNLFCFHLWNRDYNTTNHIDLLRLNKIIFTKHLFQSLAYNGNTENSNPDVLPSLRLLCHSHKKKRTSCWVLKDKCHWDFPTWYMASPNNSQRTPCRLLLPELIILLDFKSGQ